MRIIGGVWRGRPLRAPAGRATRPTSDKVREAMFGILLALPEVARASAATDAATDAASDAAGPLAGHAVLDLFAGSGALGLEALSRGAESCTFVESAPAALRALRENLARVGVPVVRPPAGVGKSAPAGSDPVEAAAGPDGEESTGAGAAISSAGGAPPHAVVLAADVRRALAADARRAARYTLVFADPPYDQYEQVRPDLVRLLGPVLAPGAVLVLESGARTAAGLPWPVVREKRYGDTRVTVLVARRQRNAGGSDR